MAAVMLFLQQTTGKTERHTHFCMPLEPVFTRDCGGRVHFTDEPTGNLDQKNSREIIDMLKLSNRNLNQTILLITHDEKIALEADRMVVIEDGQIVSDGKKGGRALS